MLSSQLARRLFAGIWFAVAAAIPVGIYFLIFLFSPFTSGTIYRVITTVVPILAAGIIGLWLGASILDEKKTKSVWQAALRGLAIAVLSYLLFFLIELYAAVIYDSNVNSKNIFILIETLVFMFLIGLILVGWLIAATGAAAGGLLYLFRINILKQSAESDEL